MTDKRTGKELLLASKQFTAENTLRSWTETLVTLLLSALFLALTFWDVSWGIRITSSIICGLLYVRMFVIYHDYQHRAILKNSSAASILMKAVGLYLLAPQTIWVRSHEHHHNNNSKLTITGIGSYPTISKARYLGLSKREKQIYLLNRHPLTIIFGYFTLFVYWLNLKSFIQSPKRHVDSFIALAIHFAAAFAIWYYAGFATYLVSWFIPFFIAFATGAYLFYCQHNFPSAKFQENEDWT